MADLKTKAFDAQDALVAALAAVLEPLGWTVQFGLPARRDELHVWVDEQIDQWAQGEPTTGLVSRSEDFRLNVYVYARHTGATAQELRDDVNVAAGAVQDTVGAEPFLGGVVLLAQVTALEYDGAFADPEGRTREAALHITVGCSTWLA